MEVVAGKDQSLQADERTAAFTNETRPYTKKGELEINIRIDLVLLVHILLLWNDIINWHRIGLSTIKMVVKCSGDSDRHFLMMLLLFRLAGKIVLKSLPTMFVGRPAAFIQPPL